MPNRNLYIPRKSSYINMVNEVQMLSKLGQYVGRRFSGYRVADESEKNAIMEAVRNIWLETNNPNLGVLSNVQQVRIYDKMLNPPQHIPGSVCVGFEKTVDFDYDAEAKTLRVGGYLEDLYLFGKM